MGFCRNQWQNKSHMLTPSFAKIKEKLPFFFFLFLIYFRMIYERMFSQSISSKKVGPNLPVIIAMYVAISSCMIPDKITFSVDCHHFKIILSYSSSCVKFSPCSKCLSLVSSTQAHSSLRVWAKTHANMPDLKEVKFCLIGFQ